MEFVGCKLRRRDEGLGRCCECLTVVKPTDYHPVILRCKSCPHEVCVFIRPAQIND